MGRRSKNKTIRKRAQAKHTSCELASTDSLEEGEAKPKGKAKKIVFITALVALLLVAASAMAAMLYYNNLQNRMTVPQADIPQRMREAPQLEPTEPFNLVIFGQDSREGADENERTNVIMLARIDPDSQQIWLVSIPRDTRVELPGYGARKINAAYDRGGLELAIDMVEDVSGQNVDHFLTIDFNGFERVVDAVGGVEIDVPIDIDDPRADFSPDGSAQRIDAGLQVLDGIHALTFVRHRASYIDQDIGRTRAQQLFFRSMIEQMSDVPLTRLPGVANALADNVTTNLTPMQMLQIARDMRGVSADDFYSITLPGEWITPFIYLDEEASARIWEQFGIEPFDSEDDEEEADYGYEGAANGEYNYGAELEPSISD